MGIQNDAGELLVYIYKKYTEEEYLGINDSKLIEETKWDKPRIRRAINYLKERILIRATFFLGGGFFVDKLYPDGIDIIEDKDKFKGTFGFTINLGLISFSWSDKK